MIRAVYRDGKIQLLDGAPADWRDGQEVYVESLGGGALDESYEQWAAEMDAASAGISDDDHDRMDAALAEIEARSKELGRRETERLGRLFRNDMGDERARDAG
jgi:hypothetical protein